MSVLLRHIRMSMCAALQVNMTALATIKSQEGLFRRHRLLQQAFSGNNRASPTPSGDELSGRMSFYAFVVYRNECTQSLILMTQPRWG